MGYHFQAEYVQKWPAIIGQASETLLGLFGKLTQSFKVFITQFNISSSDVILQVLNRAGSRNR